MKATKLCNLSELPKSFPRWSVFAFAFIVIAFMTVALISCQPKDEQQNEGLSAQTNNEITAESEYATRLELQALTTDLPALLLGLGEALATANLEDSKAKANEITELCVTFLVPPELGIDDPLHGIDQKWNGAMGDLNASVSNIIEDVETNSESLMANTGEFMAQSATEIKEATDLLAAK